MRRTLSACGARSQGSKASFARSTVGQSAGTRTEKPSNVTVFHDAGTGPNGCCNSRAYVEYVSVCKIPPLPSPTNEIATFSVGTSMIVGHCAPRHLLNAVA